MRVLFLYVRIWRLRRQILKYKNGPRTKRDICVDVSWYASWYTLSHWLYSMVWSNVFSMLLSGIPSLPDIVCSSLSYHMYNHLGPNHFFFRPAKCGMLFQPTLNLLQMVLSKKSSNCKMGMRGRSSVGQQQPIEYRLTALISGLNLLQDTYQTRHWSNAVLMLGQRLRRWPTLNQNLVSVPCLLGKLPLSIRVKVNCF